THARQLQELLDPSSLPRVHWIVALETLAQPAELERLVDALGPERLIFSLDQRGGRMLTAEASAWPDDAASIAALVVASGIRRMILLDLASVGRSAGVASLPLCRLLHTRYAAVELIAG